ncbi:helicase [Candidatus Kaiserbacteria bacterium CG10_big_fil_rev_8_21_14_0_10_49_17]|uniref:Helicase n=1 Tax=Candidatus Kaiserbacteria bacterium CG10_big_fil_rev_8_21_14_0_10_49_17 TaxID=1974609 RepID=A0A2M6WEL7_9BACT|nr:MAG: helicase [Candidatus Kaiserbacteria bacterium CG10_big_fil_rev_8_21_14_0_10_49_17]
MGGRIASMTQEQALDILKAGRNVFLTGPAGSGKTHTLRAYISYLKERGVEVALTASTGIAATHIGGTTIHSFSGIGIRDELSDFDIEEMQQKEHLYKRFDKTKVIIIDEVSMLSPYMFDSLERLARAMKRNNEPFGGMQLVLSGDFFQLPPIVKGSSEIRFATDSNSWQSLDIRPCYLSEQFRHDEDPLFSVLTEMRSGEVSDESRALLGEQHQKEFDGIEPTRLYTHNIDVDRINAEELEKLPGKLFRYSMESKGKATIVSALKKGVLAPETLELKEDALVMFVKNNFEAGYVNGTLGVIEGFVHDFPIVRTFDGKRIEVEAAEWVVEEGEKVLASVMQLPLRLAWAITIHKSQGMSLDAADIDLSKCFVPGQGYVALSRLRSLAGLSLRGMNEMALSMNPHVLVLDERLRADSKKWEQVAGRFTREEMEKMHREFIEKCGGTLDEDEIVKNRQKEKEVHAPKKSTFEKTRELLEKGMGVKEIAKERGMTVGTIIGHLERIDGVDIEHLKPKESDLKKIREAFNKVEDKKLSPVHRKLKGKYSYEELRLARLFL